MLLEGTRRQAEVQACCQRRNRTPKTAAPVMVIKYGNAIHTILKYESLISGAIAEVSKNRNAA